jgi:hypothetical protein
MSFVATATLELPQGVKNFKLSPEVLIIESFHIN